MLAFTSPLTLGTTRFSSPPSSLCSRVRSPPHNVQTLTPKMAAAADSEAQKPPIDMAKRRTMNVILFSAASATATTMLVPFAAFFIPKSGAGGGGGGIVAKDALGNDVKKETWIKSHPGGSRELVQGIRGDATYLTVKDDKSDLEDYALNAVCTHLGCVVPWNAAQNRFICPCHGSQYDKTGKVVRGPAPLSLALEHVDTNENGDVLLKSWKETDFRTEQNPWWNF